MPARLREILQICERHFGISSEPPKRGSHWKLKRDNARTYPIPAGNGERTEIPDHYVRALCRNFGIDYDEMKKLLGQ